MAKIKDKMAATATVRAELTKDTTTLHPCPKCGKGSKARRGGKRICVNPACRNEFDAS